MSLFEAEGFDSRMHKPFIDILKEEAPAEMEFARSILEGPVATNPPRDELNTEPG